MSPRGAILTSACDGWAKPQGSIRTPVLLTHFDPLLLPLTSCLSKSENRQVFASLRETKVFPHARSLRSLKTPRTRRKIICYLLASLLRVLRASARECFCAFSSFASLIIHH